ncbi:MAG: hypothetical protein C0402_13910 [Thermodesulfovibrio sp.]|nr:hypothetical protein [Thermodesulfovibrio sp.]
MKKIIMVLPVLFILAVSPAVFAAGPGTGTCPGDGIQFGQGYGPGEMTPQQQLLQNICSGNPETIIGQVTGAWVPGAGLTIQTDAGAQSVFGLGPLWYWDSANIDRPEIGEGVSVVASAVTVTDKKVILSITIDGQTLQLRDPATCLPVWRGKRTSQGNTGAPAGPAFVQ